MMMMTSIVKAHNSINLNAQCAEEKEEKGGWKKKRGHN